MFEGYYAERMVCDRARERALAFTGKGGQPVARPS